MEENNTAQRTQHQQKYYSRRALFSVSDKAGTVEFAQALKKLNFEIVSSGGTAKNFRDNGLEVIDVSQITGFPECFGGRIKTINPKVEGAILFRSDNPEDVAKAAELGIERIHLVVCNLYPFQRTVANPQTTFGDAIENIDIGGPTMIRAAAKNYPDVIVICDPADYGPVLNELQQTGDVSRKNRLKLAKKVFAIMAEYDGAIDQYLGEQTGQISEHLHLKDGRQLAYAENKSQNPAFIYSGGGDNPLAISKFQVVAGDPSFIAMADASQLVSIMCLMAETFRRYKDKVPFIAIAGKHGNPCGAGVSWDNEARALNKALMGDSVAIMGGELITNFPIAYDLGQEACYADKAKIGRDRWGLDEILAPSISPEVVEFLGKKVKRRLLVNPTLIDSPFPREEWTYRELHGGDWLKQRLPKFVLAPDQIVSWTNKPLQDEHVDDLIIAFACCWRASSNTVALAKNEQLIGLGCGQQDRIACVRLCLDRANRAGHNTKGAVFASDAFFPFAKNADGEETRACQLEIYYPMIERCKQTTTDEQRVQIISHYAELFNQSDRREGPELLRDAGCIGGVVPADGKHLAEVIEFFGQAGMSVALVTPENRGFAKH